jgi:hypothetical protein
MTICQVTFFQDLGNEKKSQLFSQRNKVHLKMDGRYFLHKITH